jgi:signal transduction histidine kinase
MAGVRLTKGISIFLLLACITFAEGQSVHRIDSLQSELNNANSDSLKVRLMIALSVEYEHVNHANAHENAEQALAIAQRNQWPWALYTSYRQLSLLAALSGDFSSALTYDNSNLEIAVARNDSSAIAEILNFIGNDYTDMGQYDEAYMYFTQAHGIANAIDDSLRMCIALHNVGTVFKELEQYDIALKHFSISRSLGEKIGDDDGLAYFLDATGDVYLRTKDFERARSTLTEAHRIVRQRKLWVIEHRPLTKLAQLALEQGDYDRAAAYYDTVTLIHTRTDNEFGLAETNLGKSKLSLALGRIAEAQQLATETLITARQLNAHRLVIQAHALLSTIAERKGDFSSALRHYKNFKIVSDSASSQKMIQKLYQTQLRFETANKDTEIALLSKANAAQDEAYRRQSFLRNILVVIIALTAILLFSIYRSGQRRIRINKLLMEHQAEIKKRSLELEQLNQVKDKFFSIISHDLRSPVNALAGILDLAEKKRLEPHEFVQLTKELRTQFNHTKTLINNLLDWTLLQMDKLNIQAERVDLHSMVEGNFTLFSSLQLKQTTMINSIPQGMYALADVNMVNLVFRNLILNAIKFTEAGGMVEVAAAVENNMVHVSVIDNGVGIHPEVQAILFDKTSGYSTRGTANEKGTGLGLILCKEFVEKNGGTIWLESAPGQGSTFHFTLKKA